MASALAKRLDASAAVLAALRPGAGRDAVAQSEAGALGEVIRRDGVSGDEVVDLVAKVKQLPLDAATEEKLILAIAEGLGAGAAGGGGGKDGPASCTGAAGSTGGDGGGTGPGAPGRGGGRDTRQQDYTALLHYVPAKVLEVPNETFTTELRSQNPSSSNSIDCVIEVWLCFRVPVYQNPSVATRARCASRNS